MAAQSAFAPCGVEGPLRTARNGTGRVLLCQAETGALLECREYINSAIDLEMGRR